MLAIILGTRPEIIKMSPIIRSRQKKGVDFFILHTGQHYSNNLEKVFFEELNLPTPDFNLDVTLPFFNFVKNRYRCIGRIVINHKNFFIQLISVENCNHISNEISYICRFIEGRDYYSKIIHGLSRLKGDYDEAKR
jgi:hypothetical protein